MTLLLDTHAFLWFVTGDARLSRAARRRMEAGGSRLVLSVASIWEMAIKNSLGRLALPAPLPDYIEEKRGAGFGIMSVEWTHAVAVAGLPFHHNDPFDRLIIAQGLAERLPIVSGDPAFLKYGVKVIW